MFLAVFLAFLAFAMALATPNTATSRHTATSRLTSRHTATSRSLFTQDAYLQAHNKVRLAHGAQDLVWNTTLERQAQAWADGCLVQHSDGTLLSTPYGENIVAGTGAFSITDAVDQFTADESDYDPSNPSYLHFTQVVWKSTTQLGCALAQCGGVFDGSLANYHVCLYDPAGNVIGEAPANVQV